MPAVPLSRWSTRRKPPPRIGPAASLGGMATTRLWLIRHGESVANVAATTAEREGLDVVPVEFRDADVPLSTVGEEQAEAFGAWLADQPRAALPGSTWCSPYWRARQTLELAARRADLDVPVRIDERLRDRELGVLDLLTSRGVESRFPEEAARRRWLGKFYYRPPGGESWADVALRVRSVLADLDRADSPEHTLIAAHDAVVMSFIYVCTALTEAGLLEFTQTHTVANASVTRLSRAEGSPVWTLEQFSSADHLATAGAPVTIHQGDPDVQPH
jgi:broad specificity phosphatase PhoE